MLFGLVCSLIGESERKGYADGVLRSVLLGMGWCGWCVLIGSGSDSRADRTGCFRNA